MKVYWQYSCDYGHFWTFLREELLPEIHEDTMCPFGHQAVTLKKMPPVDEVQITLQPAAYVADDVTGQIIDSKKYKLIITEKVGSDITLISCKTYSWQEILKLTEKFHGLSKDKAWKLWATLEP